MITVASDLVLYPWWCAVCFLHETVHAIGGNFGRHDYMNDSRCLWGIIIRRAREEGKPLPECLTPYRAELFTRWYAAMEAATTARAMEWLDRMNVERLEQGRPFFEAELVVDTDAVAIAPNPWEERLRPYIEEATDDIPS
jgi:hypothetical protein